MVAGALLAALGEYRNRNAPNLIQPWRSDSCSKAFSHLKKLELLNRWETTTHSAPCPLKTMSRCWMFERRQPRTKWVRR